MLFVIGYIIPIFKMDEALSIWHPLL